MDLKSKLSRLQAQVGVNVAAPQDTLSRLRERIAQLERSRRGHGKLGSDRAGSDPNLPTLAAAVEGEHITDGLIRIARRIPRRGKLGATPLHTLSANPRLPGEGGSADLRQVYIDTETTGLSGGSGTLAFLVGVAIVDAQAIELTQFLLTRFGAEAAMLNAFAESLSPADRLVSYNGKSYDLPLLIARFRMQGLPHPFDTLPHLDLLHPVRRLFSRRWEDCRLLSLEQKLLGFNRVDDLPGSEAPAAWFSYLRRGHQAPLVRVVEHNRQDIVSLAVAHSTLTRAIDRPQDFGADIEALARWLSESDERQARALLQAHADSLCDAGKRLLGHLSRRAGDWQQAASIWETLAARGCTDSMERLAKYHEHVTGNLAAAQRYCETLPAGTASDHRRGRVMQKLAQASARRRPL